MLLCRLRMLRGVQNRLYSHRKNPVGIQMLPNPLLKKVFPEHQDQEMNPASLSVIRDHLRLHELLDTDVGIAPEAEVEVPALKGLTITDHFKNIAEKYSQPYLIALGKLMLSNVPPIPPEFAFQAGWVRYSKNGTKFKAVDAPGGDAVVFDVETVVTEGGLPAMAVALSASHWYTWCSPALAGGRDHRVEKVTPDVLIPMDTDSKKKHRVVVGHNVGFDRGYIKEQYTLENSNTRFLDTLSLHVCVSGQTSEQKIMTMSLRKKKAAFEEYLKKGHASDEAPSKSGPVPKIKWLAVSSLNNLGDVHRLYCNKELEKAARDVFVTGSSDDIRKDFQFLMKYCVSDVLATRNVLCKLFPMFQERFPHPATFFGILEILTAYLPINDNWTKYLESSKRVYEKLDSEIQHFLNEVAKERCALSDNKAYESDPWLWDLDWSIQDPKSKNSNGATEVDSENSKGSDTCPTPKPKWFRDLCDKNIPEEQTVPYWESGPWSSSLLKRSIPKLLRITWNGYPVHYHSELGWGYLIPSANESDDCDSARNPYEKTVAVESPPKTNGDAFPLEAYMKIIDAHRSQETTSAAGKDRRPEDVYPELSDLGDFSKLDNDWREVSEQSKVFATEPKPKRTWPSSVELSYDIGLRGVKFRKLPQKIGSKYNVGSPLTRSMIEKYWGTALRSFDYDDIAQVFDIAKNTSYWKSVRDRISDQVAVWTSESQGAILPRILPAGNIYRKPVDRTWSTATAASEDRIGSEFKAMVQAPDGQHFVGVLEEPNELWIAALLGDAEFAGMHGSTALGWRMLQGRFLPEIGLHRATAKLISCTEQQAKVLDLIRIHGGASKLLCKTLAEFKPDLTQTEVELRIKNLLSVTKGTREWPETASKPIGETPIAPFRRLLTLTGGKTFTQSKKWTGGSESDAFNRIEKIATSHVPTTPFLDATITRALETRYVSIKYASAKTNWVLQSSAADFQHVALLSTKQLFDKFKIKGRLVLTTNDEIKYMVNSDQRYKAALALHISNLYVRSFFVERVGMDDLPYSMAFCPYVTVDKVLRRDVLDDCVTPSNPDGLQKTYGIAPGEALDIHETLAKLAEFPS